MGDKKIKHTQQQRRTLYAKYTPILQMMQEDSQNYLILRYMIETGGITGKEAEQAPIYSMRLSARIYDLRHKYKVPVETEAVTLKRGKKDISHARYYIGGES